MALVDVKSSGYEFHDGLARFRENKLFGYLANNGDVAISPQFILAEDFTDGQAIVETSTGFGIINTKGMFLLSPNYKAIDKAPEATNLYVIVDNDDNVGLYTIIELLYCRQKAMKGMVQPLLSHTLWE